MSDIEIRTEGRAGRITLTRPKALNALTYDMCMEIERALDAWATDDAVSLVMIDAEGERAFCAGGDVAQIQRAGTNGDYESGRCFWRDEYRMNAKLAEYPKPIAAFLHGFVMGGGVGLAGHCPHRIVGESVQVAMPECGIGFVPDVGGSLLLARAPGRLGDHLGLTADRMGPGDALHAGFADHFVPEADWPALKARLVETGDPAEIDSARQAPPDSPLQAAQPEIDALYAAGTLPGITAALETAEGEVAARARKAIGRNSPLSMATTLEMLRRLRSEGGDIRAALRQEYRVAHRIMERGDFLEGVRAAIIDKDRSPSWRLGPEEATPEAVAALLAPLGEDELAL
ncbi:enoyl-CoA hydratase/isomerase family protein [Salipiger mucosus]|uniref:3-hydroxyisobutyryl-CoA hydrolase n=1 Tax=Salipiger mucosus DSM 16094 TaxID=1123237 RepID=S9QAT6_9RHOB|nr:enoyl-CoA hydratase/isomerase family protein [Salipiger mucosus]EPX78486.1 3-hydroxyisobutyryl-CoA hydrolase [Salipiger mucosus DSM 16094]